MRQGWQTEPAATTRPRRRPRKPSDQPPQWEAVGAPASLIRFIRNAL